LQLQGLNNKAMADTQNQGFLQEAAQENDQFRVKHQEANPATAQAELQAHLQNLEAIRQKYRQGLTNPMSQALYDDDSRRANSMLMLNASSAIAEGQFKYRATAHAGQQQLYTQLAVSAPNEMVREMFVESAAHNTVAYVKGELGGSDDQAKAEMLRTESEVYGSVIRQNMIQDPEGMNTLFQDKLAGGQISGAEAAELGPRLQELLQRHNIAKTGDSVMAGPGPDGTTGGPYAATGGTKLDALYNAVGHGESHFNPGARTSDKGAVGLMQIEPETFAAFAKPGEKIDVPADNAAVGKRILASYLKKYNGDTDRAAVAYFSGPGNVAPAGSATPWKVDRNDGHTTVSQYVTHVRQRIAAQGGGQAPQLTEGEPGVVGPGGAPPPPPGTARSGPPIPYTGQKPAPTAAVGAQLDWYEQNAPAMIADARAKAVAQAEAEGGDPIVAGHEAEQYTRSLINNAEGPLQKQVGDMAGQLLGQISGGIGGVPITSPEQLKQIPGAYETFMQLPGRQRASITGVINTQLRQYSQEQKSEIEGWQYTNTAAYATADKKILDPKTQLDRVTRAKMYEDWQKWTANQKRQAMYPNIKLNLIDNNRLLDNTLITAGIVDPTTKRPGTPQQERDYDVFTGRMFEEIEKWQQANPKAHISPMEVSKIASQVLPSVMQPGARYGLFPNAPAGLTWGSAPTQVGAHVITEADYGALHQILMERNGGRIPMDWEIGQLAEQLYGPNYGMTRGR
jgi:hypothetical protein